MNIIVFLPLLVGIISLILGGFALLKNQHVQLNRLFFLISVFVAYSLFSEFLFLLAAERQDADFWSKVGSLWTWIFVIFTHFFFVFTKNTNFQLQRITILLVHLPATVYSILQLLTDLPRGIFRGI